jgi:hypothetical protein
MRMRSECLVFTEEAHEGGVQSGRQSGGGFLGNHARCGAEAEHEAKQQGERETVLEELAHGLNIGAEPD